MDFSDKLQKSLKPPIQTEKKGAGKSKNGRLHMLGIHLCIFLKFSLKRGFFLIIAICWLLFLVTCFSFLTYETTAEIVANYSVLC